MSPQNYAHGQFWMDSGKLVTEEYEQMLELIGLNRSLIPGADWFGFGILCAQRLARPEARTVKKNNSQVGSVKQTI